MRPGFWLKFLVAALMVPPFAFAHEYEGGSINVDHPWARPTVSALVPGAAYFILENTGEEDDRLLSVSVPDNIATQTELHRTIRSGSVSSMRHESDGVPLPAGETIRFEPGGRHVMLFDLQDRLILGESFPMILEFEKAGSIEVVVYVETPTKAKPENAASGDHHH